MVPAPASSSDSAAVTGGTNEEGDMYADALERLRLLQPVLWGFNHRNRNQHRRAAWWGAFGMLRRRVDRLVDELDSASAAAAAIKKKSKAKESRKRRLDGGGKKGDEEMEKDTDEEEKVRRHARWLLDVLVPKCYLSFSQLTADNQFATLGVVLLGALAQVRAACAPLAAVGDGLGFSATAAATTTAAIDTTTSARGLPGDGSNRDDADLRLPPVSASRVSLPDRGGAAVSRAEVARAEKLRRREKIVQQRQKVDESEPPAKPPADLAGGDASNISNSVAGVGAALKPSKSKTDDTKNTTTTIGGGESKPARKKKKTKKGGDEFDNLFKGLF
ncbi:hypothetical protein GGR52DRAFT_531311 [Hypoxylon sp. FL1284]|nr:hypothetical protein GGR52DRAFT_531311 [Hypoxylon sp. FL1284]